MFRLGIYICCNTVNTGKIIEHATFMLPEKRIILQKYLNLISYALTVILLSNYKHV